MDTFVSNSLVNFNNIETSMNMIHHINKMKDADSMIPSINAEKALDKM